MDVNTIIRENVKKMQPYSSARDEFDNHESTLVFLDANESPFGTTNRYPDPRQNKVKMALASIKDIGADQILLGNGSDEVLDLLFRAFCEPNKDNIITLPPTYGMYHVLSNLNAVENREIPLLNDFQPDIDQIINRIDQNTKLLFLCSPNNPTGNTFHEELITELLRVFTGIIVLDEAYIDFAMSASYIDKLKAHDNLVVVQTLSKAYGLAGIRIGILYASPAIISVLNKIKPPYNINKLSQEKALEGILDQSKMHGDIKTIVQQREFVAAALHDIYFVEKVFPSAANFLLVKVDDAGLRYKQLLSMGIVVRNRSSQQFCQNCLRITIGTPDENTFLIKTLKKL